MKIVFPYQWIIDATVARILLSLEIKESVGSSRKSQVFPANALAIITLFFSVTNVCIIRPVSTYPTPAIARETISLSPFFQHSPKTGIRILPNATISSTVILRMSHPFLSAIHTDDFDISASEYFFNLLIHNPDLSRQFR